MKKILLIMVLAAAIVIGLSALVAGGGWIFFSYLAKSQSEIKDLVEIESYDHQYVAAGYHVIGGATVADMTIVVVRPKESSLFDGTGAPVLIADNLSPFQILWTQNRMLEVKCSLDSTYSQKSSWRDVTVLYSPSK